MNRFIRIVRMLTLAPVAACVALAASAAVAGASPPPAVYVAVGGSDANACTKAAPCATIQRGIDVALPGATVYVAAGTYNEAHLDIAKALTLQGAGMNSTIVDAQITPTPGTYGNLLIHDTPAGAAVTVKQLTLKNPTEQDSIGEPFVVALRNPGGKVSIVQSRLSADAPSDYLPVGLDYYRDSTVPAVALSVTQSRFEGIWQAMILENPGPATISQNTFSGLTPSGGYAAEGIFDLAYGGSYYWPTTPVVSDQAISQNTFTGYNGYGIILEAGYNYEDYRGIFNGSIGPNMISQNVFNMSGPNGVAAISLIARHNSSISSTTLSQNRGTIQSPGQAIVQTVDEVNAFINAKLSKNTITVTP